MTAIALNLLAPYITQPTAVTVRVAKYIQLVACGWEDFVTVEILKLLKRACPKALLLSAFYSAPSGKLLCSIKWHPWRPWSGSSVA